MKALVHGHDPIDQALRRMRRRSDALVAILSALFVAFIAPLWIASPPPMTLYALANLAIFIIPPVAVLIGVRLGQRRLRRSLDPVRSRVREAGAFSFLHVLLTLDNGLLVQLPGSFAILSAFFDSNGSRLRPSLRESQKWTSPFRWTRLFTIPYGKKTPDLTELREDLGTRFVAATVGRCKPKRLEVEPNSPTWIATVVLSGGFGGFGRRIRADRIVDESDRIARYLQNLVQDTLSRARAVPPPHI